MGDSGRVRPNLTIPFQDEPACLPILLGVECLTATGFDLREANLLIEIWRQFYN